MESVIRIENLYKSYGAVKAVQDVSFQVKKGELFAFLGVNGAGKSTTISILCGQLDRDRGTVEICGKTDGSMKSALGVVFQHSVLDAALTVRDNLRSRAALYGIKGKAFESRLEELGQLLDFSDLYGRTLGKLSGGQRRRIDIARALLHRPRILVLDEPTTGLDPQTRKLLWDVLTDLRKKEELTVFLTTHYMEEAAEADFVVILDAGRVVAEGTPLALKNQYTGDYITLYGLSEEEIVRLDMPYETVRDGIRICVPDPLGATALVLRHPDLFRDWEVTKGKMDDVFLAVTGKHLTGGEQP